MNCKAAEFSCGQEAAYERFPGEGTLKLERKLDGMKNKMSKEASKR